MISNIGDLPMKNFFTAQNLQLLKTRFPLLHEKLVSPGIKPLGESVVDHEGEAINLNLEDKNGHPVLIYPDGVENEIARYFKMIPEDSHGVVIMIGMGLGISLDQIIRNRPNVRHITVLEPNLGILTQALRLRDQSTIFSDSRLRIDAGEDLNVEKEIFEISKALQMEDIFILQQQGSFQLDAILYGNVKDRVFSNANRYNTGGSTIRRHGKDSYGNRMESLTTYGRSFKFETLKDTGKNIPAIIVAAGPSLDKNIHLLSSLKNKAIIFSVDSALKTLLKHHCVPDFVSAIDYKDIVWEKLAGLTSHAPEVSLICSSSVCSRIPKTFPAKNIFWMFTMKNMDHWISYCIDNRTLSTGTGTVAHLNLIAASIMGCSPIVFVGQDLCYPDDKDHASDVILSNRENWQKLLSDRVDIVSMKPNYGDKPLLGCRSMFIYKEIFEEIIRGSDGDYINATEGGVFIEGTRVMTLEDAQRKYCTMSHDIRALIEEQTRDQNRIPVEKIVSEFKKVRATVVDIEKKTQKADSLGEFIRKQISGKDYSSFSDLPESVKRKTMQLDQLHGEIDKEQVVWLLLEEITAKGLKRDERLKHEIRLFESTSHKYTVWLEKNLDRLAMINLVRKESLSSFKEKLEHVITYYKKEQKLLHLMGENPPAKQLLELCHLYYGAGNYSFLIPLFRELDKRGENPPVILFYKGVLSCYHTEYEKAERSFAEAARKDPDLFSSISEFRQHWGDDYLRFAESQKEIDLNVMTYMIFKGLKAAPAHEGLLNELDGCFGDALKDLEECVQKDRNAAAQIIDLWMKNFIENTHIYGLLKPEARMRFHRSYAVFCFGEKKDQEGLLQFQKYQNYLFTSENAPSSKTCTEEGEFLHIKGYIRDAQTWYKKALEIDPLNVVAWHDMGKALQDQNFMSEAGKCYRKALDILPAYYQSHYNLALLLHDEGRFDEALKHADEAIRIQPGFIFALNARGTILVSTGQLSKALDSFNNALALNGNFPEALHNAGIVYQEQGHLDKALEIYKRVMEIDPQSEIALFNLNTLISDTCDWRELDVYGERLKKATEKALEQNLKPAENPFHSLLHYSDPMLQYKIARAYSRHSFTGLSNQERPSLRKSWSNGQQIRVGYLSSDLCDHAIGHIVSGMFQRHDKDRFSIYAYSASMAKPGDAFSSLIRNNCDKYTDISQMGPKEAADIIHKDDIHILMDMTGFTKKSRLAVCAARPAAVQISFLGFLGTTGSDFMDYLIADPVVIPDAVRHCYSEKLLFMPDCYQAMDYSHLGSEKTYNREDFNLPEDGIVFCSFNQPFKYCRTIFSTWMKILQRVPKGVLWLRKTHGATEQHLRNFAAGMGISPDRLVFSGPIPLPEHLERLKLADIALDPIQYNGGITTNNALWAGLPIITMPGTTFVQRMSASTLLASGLGELIVDSLLTYEEKAVNLASSSQMRLALKAKIDGARRTSPVFNADEYVRNLEALLTAALEND